jgi:hypothetical protein
MLDSILFDWVGTPIDNRVYGAPFGSVHQNMLLNPLTSILRDSGTPRSRISYRAGVCAPACDAGGIDTITWGPWFHPYVPATVNAAAPTLTATSPTHDSPGVKLTIDPGAHSAAPMFLIYRNNYVIGRVGPTNLDYTDTEPDRPKNTYQVRACYADCGTPDYPFGDGWKAATELSAAQTAWAANTLSCKTLGPVLYAAGLDWRSACTP